MRKRDVRFVPDPERRQELSKEWLAKLDHFARELTWASIESFLFHINNNNWELSRQFGIHVAAVVAFKRVFCEEGFIVRYEVWEYIQNRMIDEVNDGRATMRTLQTSGNDRSPSQSGELPVSVRRLHEGEPAAPRDR